MSALRRNDLNFLHNNKGCRRNIRDWGWGGGGGGEAE